ncbi:hypothetical protein BDV95DRAFT_594725 [Massariosphaeria phaeospora]|uniref:Uncharacterized protein n=1 Tax=Massariosphaeria phaeospora TaxID=100035 RepID=A0A7C8IAT3_9PLEO|nr:hypothetical protein BDV95DRAFT_594725 [Massariosphaeria phaeospora]
MDPRSRSSPDKPVLQVGNAGFYFVCELPESKIVAKKKKLETAAGAGDEGEARIRSPVRKSPVKKVGDATTPVPAQRTGTQRQRHSPAKHSRPITLASPVKAKVGTGTGIATIPSSLVGVQVSEYTAKATTANVPQRVTDSPALTTSVEPPLSLSKSQSSASRSRIPIPAPSTSTSTSTTKAGTPEPPLLAGDNRADTIVPPRPTVSELMAATATPARSSHPSKTAVLGSATPAANKSSSSSKNRRVDVPAHNTPEQREKKICVGTPLPLRKAIIYDMQGMRHALRDSGGAADANAKWLGNRNIASSPGRPSTTTGGAASTRPPRTTIPASRADAKHTSTLTSSSPSTPRGGALKTPAKNTIRPARSLHFQSTPTRATTMTMTGTPTRYVQSVKVSPSTPKFASARDIARQIERWNSEDGKRTTTTATATATDTTPARPRSRFQTPAAAVTPASRFRVANTLASSPALSSLSPTTKEVSRTNGQISKTARLTTTPSPRKPAPARTPNARPATATRLLGGKKRDKAAVVKPSKEVQDELDRAIDERIGEGRGGVGVRGWLEEE